MPSPLESEQLILNSVYTQSLTTPSASDGFLRVSTLNSPNVTASFTPLSADSSSISAKQGDASNLRVSVIGLTVGSSPLSADSSSISAKQGDASNLRVSSFSNDAGLHRVSAIGVSVTTSPLSADSSSISAKQGDASNLMVSAKSNDGSLFRVSAIVDSGSVSARSGDANQVHVSSVQGDAGLQRTSSLQGDAGLFRISAILAAGVSSVGAASFGVSAAQNDAGALHASAFVDSGSISAKSGDANQIHVSAVQGDGSLLRISALNSAVTVNTGGTSLFSTSAGIAQTSAIKAAAGRLYGWYLGNPAGVDQYLQVFNASAVTSVGLGTTVPDMRFYVPTLGGADAMGVPGIGFSNGIVVAVTSTADGNTAGASGMRMNLFYA